MRTACESLAVSTLLAENSSSSGNSVNVPGQQTSKENPEARANGDSGSGDLPSSSDGPNLYPASSSALDQVPVADDPVFSVIFGHGRDENVTEGTTEERAGLSSSKELQEATLDLTQENLSDIGDVEVH